MVQWFQKTGWHWVMIVAVQLLCTLPNLGAHSLWDVDEGVNAEAAREMREADTWIVPTFNYELRTAKPVMLYWWQRASYAAFGVNEWAARFPSVLASLGSVLLTYWLARRLFDPTTGLLSAIMLSVSLEFCMLSHTASPDAVLLFFLMAGFTLFGCSLQKAKTPWCAIAVCCALAVLTKGPIGVGLPGLIFLVYLAWQRDWPRLSLRSIGLASVCFLLVALPWYVLVGVETRGQFLKVFLGRENVTRFLQPMENHSGNPFYHVIALFIGFAPGSIFLTYSAIEAYRFGRAGDARYRFLTVWIGVYLLVFSVAATKLPNYVLPVYPAVAILVGRMLTRWLQEQPCFWPVFPRVAVFGMLIVAMVTVAGFLVAGGIPNLNNPKFRTFPGLAVFAWLGLPMFLAAGLCWKWSQTQRARYLKAFCLASIFFTAGIASLPVLIVDRAKAPKDLILRNGLNDTSTDLRLGALYWFQPSSVFYAERQIRKLQTLEELQQFVSNPTRAFVFMDETTWKDVEQKGELSLSVRDKEYDFYTNKMVYLLENTRPIKENRIDKDTTANDSRPSRESILSQHPVLPAVP